MFRTATVGDGCSKFARNGFDDIRNLYRSVKIHEKSKDHISASTQLSLLGRVRIDTLIDEGYRAQRTHHNEIVRKNREVMERLIDTTLLGRQELSFRGHDESANSDNKGNSREFAEVLSHYDEVLEAPFESATVFTGTSKDIQNDLIDAVSTNILEEIKK